jgi:phage tail tube protein FII
VDEFRRRSRGHASFEHEFDSDQEETMADTQELRGSNLEKDPADWKTGDEPMTAAQASYLRTLSDQASEPFEEDLTKAEASRRIDELQQRTGRGQS